jgi:hypothetical protein
VGMGTMSASATRTDTVPVLTGMSGISGKAGPVSYTVCTTPYKTFFHSLVSYFIFSLFCMAIDLYFEYVIMYYYAIGTY